MPNLKRVYARYGEHIRVVPGQQVRSSENTPMKIASHMNEYYIIALLTFT
jgi:hypothetical protein